MILRVDYHFHPNLPLIIPFLSKYLCKRKSEKIWQAFERHNLDAVIISEHSYKRPKTSFQILKKYKPKDAKTLIIPGVEAITKEGIDIIAFAKNEIDIYSQKDLITPWKLTLDEAIKLIKNNEKLFGIVVHPHTPGTTSIYRIGGTEVTHNAIEKLGFLEKHNCSFTISIRLLKKLGLHKIFKKKYHQMLNTEVAPLDLIKKNTITTVGSDAHHIKEIGNFAEIEIPDNEKDIFKIITTKSGIWHKKDKENFLTFLQNILFTTPLEFFIKKLRLYKIDKPIA